MSEHGKILKSIFRAMDTSMKILHNEIDLFVKNVDEGKDYSENYLELIKMGFHLEIFLPELLPTGIEHKIINFLKEKISVETAEKMKADAHEFYHFLEGIALDNLKKKEESPEVVEYSSVEDFVNKVL